MITPSWKLRFKYFFFPIMLQINSICKGRGQLNLVDDIKFPYADVPLQDVVYSLDCVVVFELSSFRCGCWGKNHCITPPALPQPQFLFHDSKECHFNLFDLQFLPVLNWYLLLVTCADLNLSLSIPTLKGSVVVESPL